MSQETPLVEQIFNNLLSRKSQSGSLTTNRYVAGLLERLDLVCSATSDVLRTHGGPEKESLMFVLRELCLCFINPPTINEFLLISQFAQEFIKDVSTALVSELTGGQYIVEDTDSAATEEYALDLLIHLDTACWTIFNHVQPTITDVEDLTGGALIEQTLADLVNHFGEPAHASNMVGISKMIKASIADIQDVSLWDVVPPAADRKGSEWRFRRLPWPHQDVVAEGRFGSVERYAPQARPSMGRRKSVYSGLGRIEEGFSDSAGRVRSLGSSVVASMAVPGPGADGRDPSRGSSVIAWCVGAGEAGHNPSQDAGVVGRCVGTGGI